MTREDRELALYCLKASSDYHSEVCEECIKYPNCDHTMQDDVTETIIKALEQEPCGNAISRQMAIDEIRKCRFVIDAIEKIRALPPVTPQPKTGEWIEERTYMECPNCHDIWHYEENQTERFKFCPTCGEKIKQ